MALAWLFQPRRATLPPPAAVEYRLTSGPRQLLVSRPLNRAALRTEQGTYICALAGPATDKYGNTAREGWILTGKTFIHIDPQRPSRLPHHLAQRLRDLWNRAGESELRQEVEKLVGPPAGSVPLEFARGSLTTKPGPPWEGQPTLTLTWAYRTRPGSGALAWWPGPWRYLRRGYVPALGFNLEGEEDSPWSQLKVGPLDPQEFAVPPGYRELWTDEELNAGTPKMPPPPAGYRAIGGLDARELDGGGTLLATTWMPDGVHWSCGLWLYFLRSPQDVQPLLEGDQLRWLGFKQWDKPPLAPQRTARVAENRLLLVKGSCVARLELRLTRAGAQPPEHTAVLTELARYLSARLP